jgi:dienelactone hydrolase
MPEAPPAPPEPAAEPAEPAGPPVETKEVEYSSGKTPLKGFLAYPEGDGKHPAVIVVHEWWGLNDYARSRATQLAQLGYVAFAIDMYGEGKNTDHPEDAKGFMTAMMSDMDEAVKRFDAAVALLKADARVEPEKLASIGYCMGGAVSLHMARLGRDLDLVATFHANLATKKPMAKKKFKGEILVAQGGADPFVPTEQVEAFKKEMDKAGAKYALDVYEGAKHGFTNPHATEAGAKFELPLAYDEAADRASWDKFTAKLKELWGS